MRSRLPRSRMIARRWPHIKDQSAACNFRESKAVRLRRMRLERGSYTRPQSRSGSRASPASAAMPAPETLIELDLVFGFPPYVNRLAFVEIILRRDLGDDRFPALAS